MESRVTLRRIEYPVYSRPAVPAPPSVEELNGRLARCREAMRRRGLTRLLVYGDREHFANLMYLLHFDPRFEEALLVVGLEGRPLLLVGNECEGHLGVSPLWRAGGLRSERFQSFSLLGQPRDDSRPLREILAEEGIDAAARVGIVGWKYFVPGECDDPDHAIDAPAYLVDVVRRLAAPGRPVNAADLFVAPSGGLRSILTACEIARFEYANVMGSEAMRNLLENFRAGCSDFELMGEMRYTGAPLSCHMSLKSSGNLHYGLSSPTGDLVRRGDPCSAGIAYWGSNICRAGWVAADERDLPDGARDYFEAFVAPYFLAVRAWLRALRIGTAGGDLHRLIARMLPFDRFGVYLNPGHLIHYDEWTSTPIYAGSKERIRSGMYFQIDIIPRSPVYSSTRMEEGVVVADAALRGELRDRCPDVYDRCMARRRFMASLGFDLPDELLPLSNLAGIIVPYFLDCRSVPAIG